MSQNLYNFLLKLDVELMKRSRTYRTRHSDKTAHAFRLSKASLFNETMRQLNLMGIKDFTNDQMAPIRDLANSYYTRIKERTQTEVNEAFLDRKKSYFKADSFRAYFLQDKDVNIFERVKRNYRDLIQEYFIAVKKEVLKKRSAASVEGREKLRNLEYGGQFLQMGHEEGHAVFESGLTFALDRALSQFDENTDLHYWLQTNTKEFMSRFVAIMGNKEDTVKITLESAIDNMSRGGATGAEKVKIKKDLGITLQQLAVELALVTGSDSIISAKRKKAIKEVTDPFRKNKKITVVTENTKIKKPATKPVKIERHIKIKPVKSFRYDRRDPRTGRFIAEKKTHSPINILNMIESYGLFL
jgi:hypothetical protein